MEDEVFKDIEGYEGLYQVSNHGRVKSLERQVNGKNCCLRTIEEKVLTPGLNGRGYLQVILYNGVKKNHTIHRLVAFAFCKNSNPENYNVVNHLDSNTSNNYYLNLEWTNNNGNSKHAIEFGVMKKGEQCSWSKLTDTDVIKIRELYKTGNYTHRELGIIYNLNFTSIGYIIRGKNWKHLL